MKLKFDRNGTCLICGDSLKTLSLLPEDCANLVLGSPPYPTKGERYGLTSGGTWPVKDWIRWMLRIVDVSLNVAPLVGFVVNDTYRNGSFHPAIDGLCWKAYQAGYTLERPLIWTKNAPPNRKDWFGNTWERIIFFKRDSGPIPTWNPDAIGTPPKFKAGGDFRQRDGKGQRRKGGKYPTNPVTKPRDVIYATVGGGHLGHKLAHENEAPYPESLITPLVLALTNGGDVILDPFLGSGTTAAVAVKTGRKCIGIELREDQLDITRQRLKTL